jgi:hypothetical protein
LIYHLHLACRNVSRLTSTEAVLKPNYFGNVQMPFVKRDAVRAVEVLQDRDRSDDASPLCAGDLEKAVTVPADADVASSVPAGLNARIRGDSLFLPRHLLKSPMAVSKILTKVAWHTIP